MYLDISKIIKFGDVEGCFFSTPPPPPPSTGTPQISCGTTCGQDRVGRRSGQKIVNGVDASAGEIGWQVRFGVVL